MNILFFLKPKSEVAYLYDDITVRQALEKMEYHGYSAIPVIDREGHYTGTLTEGDMLWGLKDRYDLNIRESEEIPLKSIPRRRNNRPVHADSNMEDLVVKAMSQNFVPVVDDKEIFIGIITRKDIIQFFYDKARETL